MHTSADVFLDEGDEAQVGGNGDPFVWVRIGVGIDLSIFGRNADQLDEIGTAFLRAAADLRAVEASRPVLVNEETAA